MKIFHICRLSVCVMTILFFATTVSFAHGKKGHGQDHDMSPHMQAMYALKDKVPEDYSIMNRTPIIPDEKSLDGGAKLYQQQCAVCHGQNGLGEGPAAKGLSTKPANFMDVEHSAIYGPGEKFWIIGNGSGTTGMPAFPSLSLIDRWNLVNHIYRLQGAESREEKHKHNH